MQAYQDLFRHQLHMPMARHSWNSRSPTSVWFGTIAD